MSSVIRIDHVAIVVDDIDSALDFWRDALGLEVTHVEDVPEQQSVVAFLLTGESEVELVKPTADESGVYRYLHKRGPGLHHICFQVDNIEVALAKMRKHGVRLINPEPVIGTGGKRIAFIHPESTHGVLIELYELTYQEPEIRLARARELADRVRAQGQVVAANVLEFLRGLRDTASEEIFDDS
ncbi:MAG TPA: methylmalonyl-CoA epimerase [Anaerolineae bacterium]|nr:methylmalonyl-CoA epimerase [Anaerolineae bacterium]